MTYILCQRSQYAAFDCLNKTRLPGRFENFKSQCRRSAEVEQRSKKTEENKHGAVIAGCSAESQTRYWG